MVHLFRQLSQGRLASGLVANFVSLGSYILVQIVSVPVLLAAYGVEGFGVWLILATIPIYLAMSDFGLITAAGSEMAIQWARGDQQGVLTTFQSVGGAMVVIAISITTAFGLFVSLTSAIDGFWPMELQPHLWVIPILTAYAGLFQVSFVAIAALRATGYFARGTLIGDGSTFVENLAMLATATLTRDMTLSAAAMLILRLMTTPLMYLEMRRVRPQLYAGIKHARKDTLRRLLPSALGVLTIPASLAISLQGTALIVGAMLGPAAVAVFSSVRTASRFAVQVASMIVRAFIPEVAAAHGRKDLSAERRYWSMFNYVRWFILLPGGIGFALLGTWIVDVWSQGYLYAPPALVAVMGVAILAHGSWFLDLFMLTATHRHVKLALPILAGCLLGLPLTVLATKMGGLVAAALSVLAVDIVLAILVRLGVKRETAKSLETGVLSDNEAAS